MKLVKLSKNDIIFYVFFMYFHKGFYSKKIKKKKNKNND